MALAMFSTAMRMKPSATSSGGCAGLVRERGEAAAHDVLVERRVARSVRRYAERMRRKFADHHIRIGDGERPAAAIAIGPGSAPAESGPTRKRAPS